MNFRLDINERIKIEEMLNDGITIKGICLALKRSQAAISAEIKKNGGIRLYNAQKAQEKSDRDKKESNKDKNSPVQHLRHRIDELEKQVKILMDLNK